MGEQDSISGVWREALAIIRRYPAAVVVPGAVLGPLAEAPTYLIVDRLLLDQLLTYLAAAFAYYLYLAYAEGLTTDYERGEDLTASRSRLTRLLEAAFFVPRVLVAALVSVSLALAAVYSGDLQGGYRTCFVPEAKQRAGAGTLLVRARDGHARLRLGGGGHPRGCAGGGHDHGIAYLGRVGRWLDRRCAGHTAGRPH